MTERQAAAPGQAVAALMTGALVWGLVWYPYRVLRDAGIDGVVATTATYLVAVAVGFALFRPPRSDLRPSWRLLWLALAAGGCNVGYVLATLDGEVLRVMLLFYLAPLWTVLLARLLLGERLHGAGYAVVLLSLAGAATILWQPAVGLPLPQDGADWLGLGAGFSFALFNVLSRRNADMTIEGKALVSFIGVVLLGLGLTAIGLGAPPPAGMPAVEPLFLLVLVGVILALANLVVQFGLKNVAANRAIVIMLCEVVFAAVSAWFLAGEHFGLQEAVGGAMIVAASLFSAQTEAGT